MVSKYDFKIPIYLTMDRRLSYEWIKSSVVGIGDELFPGLDWPFATDVEISHGAG